MTKSDRENFHKAVKLIENAKTIDVFTHLHIDGDALGSAFGIAYILTDLGKKVKIFLEEDPGDKFRYLMDPEIEFHITGDDVLPYENEKPDLAIVTDCATRDRVKKRYEICERAGKIIKIDHHMQDDNFGDVNVVREDWSAVCEGIFLLSKMLGYDFKKAPHGKKAAIALYTGILTDSGRFGYSNTTSFTHKAASELLKITGDMSDTVRNLFSIKPFSKVKIYGIAFSRAELLCDGKFAFSYVTGDEMEETGATFQEIDGISSELCEIEGVELSALAKPSSKDPKKWGLSLRSYKYCDVASIAVKYGGGGHARAAGFDYEGTTEEIKELLIGELKKY